MKQYPRMLVLLVGLCAFASCRKADFSNETGLSPATASPPTDSAKKAGTTAVQSVPYPQPVAATCENAPDYGDSILFAQPVTTQDAFALPVNNGGVSGTYLSWPDGLSLNPKTGAIDLTKSETGARYDIAFVKDGTTDTCMSHLIVGGAAYLDSVYVLANSDTTSAPYFNANVFMPSPCNGSHGGPSSCAFDVTNSAKSIGVAVDKKTGFIDLKKSMKNNLFGLLPVNGMSVYPTIYYQLNDESNNAVQSIQVQLMFYNKKSDIPPSVLAQITGKLTNALLGTLINKSTTPRPPLIVITRAN